MPYANYVHAQRGRVIYTHAWRGCVAPICMCWTTFKSGHTSLTPLSRHVSSRQACAPLLSLPPLLKLYILWSILMQGNTSHDGLAVVVRDLHSQLLQVQFRNLLEEKYLATFKQSSLKYSALISHVISLWGIIRYGSKIWVLMFLLNTLG